MMTVSTAAVAPAASWCPQAVITGILLLMRGLRLNEVAYSHLHTDEV